VSKRDKLNIHFSREGVKTMINDIIYLEETKCRQKYDIPSDVRDWNFDLAKTILPTQNKVMIVFRKSIIDHLTSVIFTIPGNLRAL
jgi:hypothetical protein